MKSEATVRQLVDKIEAGEIVLPEMQRGYVWRSTNVRDLFDSLYRGYPSGVILGWETDLAVEVRDFAVETVAAPTRPMLLLDGQQRLTSLSAIIKGKGVCVRDRKHDIKLLFNLEHADELPFVTAASDLDDDDATEADMQERITRSAFVVYNSRLAAQAQWVDVSDIFAKSDSEILQAAGVTGFDDPRYNKYVARLKAVRAIQDYVYRMDILERSMSYEEVTEIFVRVNSLGVRLRGSDLALAQVTARWRGSLKIFTDYLDDVKRRGFILDMGTLLRTLVALITGQVRFRAVSGLSLADLQAGWKRTQRAIDFALDFFKSNLQVDSLALLSSPLFLVATAFWADMCEYQVSAQEAREFRRWLLTASAKGHYAGSSETKLDQDLAFLKRHSSIQGSLERLENEVGRLHFTVGEIEGRATRSPVFKLLFMALRADGAVDWDSNLVIAPTHTEKQSKIEFHHIFPKKYLKESRPDLERATVDQVANMAFIGGGTNRKISSHAPSAYKNDYAQERFTEQLIDFSDGLDQPENYEEFIRLRAQRIADRLNRFLTNDIS